MTIALYARRKQWPLQAVDVTLSHSKIHAVDCAECETKEGKLDRIETAITLTGSLSPEQREQLLVIAQKCPVHRTLTSEINIRTRLVWAASRAARVRRAARARSPPPRSGRLGRRSCSAPDVRARRRSAG